MQNGCVFKNKMGWKLRVKYDEIKNLWKKARENIE